MTVGNMEKAIILVVEDEAIIAQDLRRKLEEVGHVVPRIVSTGEQAVKTVKENKVDLILMDIMLSGGIDGIEAAEIIRADHNIPVIYLTAYTNQEILTRAKVTEPFGYLVKPVDRRELIIAIEITLYKHRAEKEILRSKEEWERTFDTIPDMVAVIDKDYKIKRANRAMSEKTGIKREDLIGRTCYSIIHGTDGPPNHCPHHRVMLEGREQIEEFRLDNPSGYYLVSSTPLFDPDGKMTGVVEVARDITERKRLEDHLQQTAVTDELTGLYNRRGFFTLAEQQCKLANRANKKLALLYIDLDGMKAINDNLGHTAGDRALVDSADIIRKSFRKSDIIARIGGDEFAVLLTEPSEDDIDFIITNNLQKNVKIYNEKNECDYKLSFSTGLAHYDPQKSTSIDKLLTEADNLMYKNKKAKSI